METLGFQDLDDVSPLKCTKGFGIGDPRRTHVSRNECTMDPWPVRCGTGSCSRLTDLAICHCVLRPDQEGGRVSRLISELGGCSTDPPICILSGLCRPLSAAGLVI